MTSLTYRLSIFSCIILFLAAGSAESFAQRRAPGNGTLREFLAEYKGKEVLILDKTTGVEQFVSGDASKAYSLILNDVQGDYIVVSRTTDTDKRTFIYPISVIRRIIYMYDNVRYQKIVIEMY